METTRRRRMTTAVAEATGETPSVPPPEMEPTPGDQITVTWGEEVFSPVQYNSFRIGGHSITVTIKPGETALAAWKRGWDMLERAADIQFQDKLDGFRRRMDQTKGR